MTLVCAMRVEEEAAGRAPPRTDTSFMRQSLHPRGLHQHLCACATSRGGQVVDREVIVEQEALLGGGAVLNARQERVGLEILHRPQLVLVVQAGVGVGACRDRTLDRVEGVLAFFRAADLEPVDRVVAIGAPLGRPKESDSRR